MALLQLAESPYNMLAENEMYLAETGSVVENYLFIPAGLFGMDQDTYVRSDFFDSLSDTEFNAVISALAPYQPQGLSAIGAIIGAATAAGQKLAPAIKKAIEGRKEKVAAGTAKPIFKPGGALSNLANKIKAGVNKLKDGERSFVVITHYQRLLDYIVPDFVHVLYKGRIVKSGDASLAKELEAKGYDWIKAEVEQGANT